MRFALLVLLNLPVILLAILNVLTQYKLKKISRGKFRRHSLLWVLIFIALMGAFPLYNYLIGRSLFDVRNLSLLDIVQTTAVIYLFYTLTRQQQQVERNEKMLRDLHREASISLADLK